MIINYGFCYPIYLAIHRIFKNSICVWFFRKGTESVFTVGYVIVQVVKRLLGCVMKLVYRNF